MPKYQLLGVEIHIGGNRDTTVVKGEDNDGITLPELYVLRALHGGAEHVHSEVVVGYVERSQEAERERLQQRYGARLVDAVFPGVSPLPVSDESYPTKEERDAAVLAAKEAMTAARTKRGKKAEPAPAPAPETPAPVIPDLTAKK